MPKFGSLKKKGKETTIFDVAQKAKVAISTVSLALRGDSGVSPKTKAAVIKAAKSLHYQPNLAAQSLARRQTNLIAVCGWFAADTLESNSGSSNHMLMGILDRLKGTRFAIYLVNWSTHPDGHRRLIRDFSDQRFICGFIWLSSSFEAADRKLLLSSSLPMALVEASEPQADSVLFDNTEGANLGTQHLLKGAKRLAVIAADPAGLVQKERLLGIKRAVLQAGMKWNAVKIFRANYYSFNDGVRLATDIAALAKPASPLAVFSIAGDRVALGLMHGLKAAGIQVPSQVAVMGWDGILEGSYFTPQLSSVVQPLHEMGFRAADALIQRLEDPETSVQLVRFQPRLALRESA